MGEVLTTINTKSLKDEFIISRIGKGSKQNGLADLEEDSVNDGVHQDVILKVVLSSIYNHTPLKLLAIYVHTANQNKLHDPKQRFSSNSAMPQKETKTNEATLMFGEVLKNEGDDLKNLKDFKNFISIRREPWAITALSTICLLFILILACSVIGLVVNFLAIVQNSNNVLELYQLTLQS